MLEPMNKPPSPATKTLLARYGPDHFKNIRAKVKKPGFSSMDKDQVKAISAKGVAARKALREAANIRADARAEK
jgi:hypothetical protein